MDDIDGESDAPQPDQEAHLYLEGARPPPLAHPEKVVFSSSSHLGLFPI
jgi:hypothetical protein